MESECVEMVRVKEIFKTCLAAAMLILALPGQGMAKQQEAYLIDYLVLDRSYVELGDEQQIVFGIGEGQEVDNAQLLYHHQETGKKFQQEQEKTEAGAVLFQLEFEEEDQVGIYELDAISFSVDGEKYVQTLEEAGIEAVFGVECEVSVEADALIEEAAEELETEIVRIDENGNEISENSLEEAIAQSTTPFTAVYGTARTQNVVVVLDPGHDKTHAGARANGVKEEELNLKIAVYCKEELEKYYGVTVYLTRSTDGSCPHPGTSATGCNKERVAFAKSVGANVYASLHNNSYSSASANGAMVFYPNKNYNEQVSVEGKTLAELIQKQLTALGLYDRDIQIRNSEDGTKYPDGSLADYYGVIRRSKLEGIPAVIVEHAFVTSPSDVNNFLNNDSKLKILGTADAAAIASYYSLSKEPPVPEQPSVPEIPEIPSESVDDTLSSVVNTPENTGLILEEGVWRYYENGVWNTQKMGLVRYDGAYFLVLNGQVSDYSGLYQEPANGKWYFLANGMIQTQYSGMALYDGFWFVLKNGMLAENYNGFYNYNGGIFLVAAGQLKTDYSGLYQDAVNKKWYFLSCGQVCTYTGLALYGNVWFYVENGILAEHYHGNVNYNGGVFRVQNGMVV